MSIFDAARYRLRSLFRPAVAEQERDEEFAFHQTLAEANKAHALRNTTHLKETMRWMGATRWIDQFGQDLRLARRGLQRAPLFTIIVVFTLALGIGTNATVIGIIDTMFFRKLPVPEPERVVALHHAAARYDRRMDGRYSRLSTPLYLDLRARVTGVDGLGAYTMIGLRSDGESVWSAAVSGNYFDLLRVTPQRGRFIRFDEEEAGVEHSVVVISDYLWRTKYNADESIVGRKIPVSSAELTVIGVAPAGFTGLHPEGRTNFWLPYPEAKRITGARGDYDLAVFARLRDGTSLRQAEGSANAAHRELALAGRSDSALTIHMLVKDRLIPFELGAWPLFWMMFVWIVIALLHLVACSNVASLMLARAAAKRRELGVRLCLGASRGRILVQSLTEASLLAALGATAGIVVWRWLTSLITSMQFISTADTGFDWRIIAIVIAVTGATVLQFGLLPAIDASRSDPMAVLRGFSSAGRGRHSRSEIIVVVQVALSMTLIANAAVFLSVLRRQSTTPPGFDANHVLVATLNARDGRSVPSVRAAYDEALARVQAVPGVRNAAFSVGAPLHRATLAMGIALPGRTSVSEQRQFPTGVVGPGYFSTIGATLVQGREFTKDDNWHPDAGRQMYVSVVVINESMAKLFWPAGNALGKQIQLHESAIPSTVVGVVRDMRDVSPTALAPRAYVPVLMWLYPPFFEVIVRVDGKSSSEIAKVTAALSRSTLIDRPVVRTMQAIRQDATSVSRTGSSALALCAGVALLLTSVGLYGLVSMWAMRRRSELGIRLALGASRAHVHGVLLSGAGRIIGTGVIIGLALAFGLIQVERASLGPTLSLGPVEIVGSLVAFALIGGLAALVPSLRATRQSLADVLRS